MAINSKGIRPTSHLLVFLAGGTIALAAAASQASNAKLSRLAIRLQHATVRIDSGQDRSSGVLISSSGLILTVAHGVSSTNRIVNIVFHDGTRSTAAVVHRDAQQDVALLKLQSKTTAPIVFLAVAEPGKLHVSDGEVVLASGVPAREADGLPNVIRIGSVVAPGTETLRTTCALTVGDSGGPLMNSLGQLIGINQKIGLGPASNLHLRIGSCLRALHDVDDMKDVARTATADSAILNSVIVPRPQLVDRSRLLTAHIKTQRKNGTPVAATLFSTNFVATKLSLVGPNAPSAVILADGTQAACSKVLVSRTDDLLILQLHQRLPEHIFAAVQRLPFADATAFEISFSGEPARPGIVSRVNYAEPPLSPKLGCELRQRRTELIVHRVFPQSAAADAGLQKGDTVRELGEVPLTSFHHVVRSLESFQPGDFVDFSIHRNDSESIRFGRLRHDAGELLRRAEFLDGRSGELSDRRSGFTDVIQHDAAVTASEMGSPLLNKHGALIGINIARRSRESVLALPMNRLSQLLRETSSAGPK